MLKASRGKMRSFALIIAWPETFCKQAGGWYDGIMNKLNFSQNGYYKVGHAAIVLINGDDGSCHYFDFGRYHAPLGHGRVRSAETDHDLKINTTVELDYQGYPDLENLISELNSNSSCHGHGILKAGLTPIDFEKSMGLARQMQEMDSILYGPFISGGTNCSRFVRSVAIEGVTSLSAKVKLSLPPMFTPTPLWNVRAVGKYCPPCEPSFIPTVN